MATNPYGGGSWKTLNAEDALHAQYEGERGTTNDQYMANGMGMIPDAWTGLSDYIKSKGVVSGRPDDYYKSLGATSWDPEHPLAYQDPSGQWNINQFDIPQGNQFGEFITVPAIFAAMIASAGAASGAIGGGAAGLESGALAGGAAGAFDMTGSAAIPGAAGLSGGVGSGSIFSGAAAGGAATGASAMDLGDWQDWGSLLDSGGSPINYNDFVGDIPTTGMGGTSIYGSNPSISDLVSQYKLSGQNPMDFIKNYTGMPNLPPGLQQALKALTSSGDSNGLASILGKLGAAGLGAYASNQQSGALSDLAAKYAAFGAPSRARYEASMQPGFDPMSIPGYAGAVDTASKGLLARLSATGGNPWGSPGALIDANKQIISGTALPAISDYQRTNLAGGGVANLNAAIPNLETSAIGQQGNVYNSLGYALNAATEPKQMSLADLTKALNLGGLS